MGASWRFIAQSNQNGSLGNTFCVVIAKDQRLCFEKAVCVFEYAMWWFIEGCREAEATKAKCKEFMEKPAPAAIFERGILKRGLGYQFLSG